MNDYIIEVVVEQNVVEVNENIVTVKGDDGDSAYQVAVNNGFVGTEQEWLDSFQDRANHIGTQAISTIENLQSELDSKTNVQSDWNATSGDSFIQNKPVLGTIASRDSTEFATAEQGSKADSAVQPNDLSPYATNEDLITGLATKEPVIVSGTTGQYWRGDKTFQTLDKNAVGLSNVDNVSDLNKPISTATQSALDLKANINSPVFTGTMVLPNNTRINGIEHFYQTTKPITRGDGSALVVGDRWWKSDEGTEWFWNGTYWLSKQIYRDSISFGSASATTTFTLPISNYLTLIQCVSFEFVGITGLGWSGINTTINYWNFSITSYYRRVNNPFGSISGINLNTIGGGYPNSTVSMYYRLFCNNILDFTQNINNADFPVGVICNVTKVESPGSLSTSQLILRYRLAY